MGQSGAAIFSVAGTVIGSYFGPVGAAIGGAVGGLIGGLIFNHHPSPTIPYVQLMNAAYGQPISIVYGDALVSGNFAWMSDPRTIQRGAGKGATGGAKGVTQSAILQDAQLIFCESPLGNAQLLKLYLDGKLYVNNSSSASFFPVGIQFTVIRICNGSENQVPDIVYEVWADEHVAGGSDFIPAYRGLASLVFSGLDVTKFGSRFPQVTAAWHVSSQPRVAKATKLNRFLGDTKGFDVQGLCVDWIRGVAYTLAGDGTLRAFNLTTGECFVQRDNTGLRGITCGQGSYVVGWSTDSHGHLELFKIDPNSLLVGAPSIVDDIFSEHAPGSWFVSALGILQFTARQGGQVASVDLSEGTGGEGTAAFYGIAIGSLHFSTFFNNSFIFQGASDPQTRVEQIWAVNWDNTDGPGIYLQRYISNTDHATRLAIETIRVFTPAEFGSGAGATTVSAFWDPSDDSIVFQNLNWGTVGSFKYRPQADQIVWTSASTGGAGSAVVSGAAQDLSVGSIDHSVLPAGWPGLQVGGAVGYIDQISVVFQGASDNELYLGLLQRVSASGYPVADIISDVCARVGLDASMIDVTLVTDTTPGYVIKDVRSAGAVVADICRTFLLDMVESDFKLKFVPRGQAEVLTIPQDDLCSIDPQDNSKYWMGHRPQEFEMPLQIVLRYADQDMDFQVGSAQAQRTALPVPTVFSKRRQAVDLSITSTNVAVRQIAEKWLYTLWGERTTYATALGPKYLELDPADNVAVTLNDGSTYHVRISATELSPALQLHLGASTEAVTTYAGSNSPGADVGYQLQTVVQAPYGQPLLFNVPLLQDQDEIDVGNMRVYMGAGSMASTWITGGMYESPDGSTYTLVIPLPGAANWGYTRNKLADTVAAFATDRMNTITVPFSPGSTPPTSCTFTDMMNGVNAAIVGQEIIQFQNVTKNSDGSYTLDTLLRGRRGTEWATGLHAVGDIFILLVVGQIFGARLSIAQRNVTEQWKLLPNGRFFDQAPGASFAYLGYDKYPYAPIGFSRTIVGSDLLLAWIRRTRIGGLLVDGTDDVPLSESSEAYEAYVLLTPTAIAAFDPATPASYTRKFNGMSAPQVTYTAAMMTADGFIPATATLYLVVYQLSAVVGRGFRGYQVLPPF